MTRWSMLAVLLAAPVSGAAQAPPSGPSEPFVVEYYYKARWGYADEFIRLFKKNHYPVLKRQMELGRIQEITADLAKAFKVKEQRGALVSDVNDRGPALKAGVQRGDVIVEFDGKEVRRLFPDQETFKHEEQRRFEILAGHWDVPVVTVDLTRP